jgi:hypothetical protein
MTGIATRRNFRRPKKRAAGAALKFRGCHPGRSLRLLTVGRYDVWAQLKEKARRSGLGLTVKGAKLEAARAASEIIRDRAGRTAEPADISIIVGDGTPTPVCTVIVALTIPDLSPDRGGRSPDVGLVGRIKRRGQTGHSG